jgi:hypothetical protein
LAGTARTTISSWPNAFCRSHSMTPVHHARTCTALVSAPCPAFSCERSWGYLEPHGDISVTPTEVPGLAPQPAFHTEMVVRPRNVVIGADGHVPGRPYWPSRIDPSIGALLARYNPRRPKDRRRVPNLSLRRSLFLRSRIVFLVFLRSAAIHPHFPDEGHFTLHHFGA